MFDGDEEPRNWEIKDEEPPEPLRKKWEREEVSGSKQVVCPSCKKETPAWNLTCIFCGETISQGGCPVRCFVSWVKRLFKKD